MDREDPEGVSIFLSSVQDPGEVGAMVEMAATEEEEEEVPEGRPWEFLPSRSVETRAFTT